MTLLRPHRVECLIHSAFHGGLEFPGTTDFSWDEMYLAAGAFDPYLRGSIQTSARALRERRDSALDRVHHTEQSRLLVEAACHAWSAAGGLGLPQASTSFAVWRQEARNELVLTHNAGLAAPRALIVASLWSPELIGAAGARELAKAAVALDPGPASLIALAYARLSSGDSEACLRALECARSRADAEERRDLERCRLLALAERGDLHAALAGVACFDSPDEVLACLGFGLALAIGDRGQIQERARVLGAQLADTEVLDPLADRASRWIDPEARVDEEAQAFAGGDPTLASTQIARWMC